MEKADPRSQDRVLVLAPTGRDEILACDLLGKVALPAVACGNERVLCREIEVGAGAVIVAEEALHPGTLQGLSTALGRQEPWSDLPLIVFAQGGDTSEQVLEALSPLTNATILERPVRISTLVSSVRAALRARRRQYEVRDLLRRQSEADRRKDEFLAMLGHELRNPLAAIRNAVWVLEEVGSEDDPTRRQREIIDRQTLHLSRMVDDLLDVSRVTLGKISLQPESVHLEEMAERCLNDLGMRKLAASRGLRLSIRYEPVTVLGDPVRLEQVICNLLQNAVKYTPRGGALSLTVCEEEGGGVLRIEDSGIGISAEMLPRIFEPFTQVESSRLRSEGGLGLGLPLVQKLVQLHGGKVEALSAGVGRGSEFIVRLPLQKVSSTARRRREPVPESEESSGLDLLIVEDNEDGRQSLGELLEIWGHRVELAESGPEGVTKALAARPDAALVDIGLPGMDGNEVARRIRDALDDDIALIAMTGYGQPEDRSRALAAGFNTYLVKPVDPADLARLLGEIAQRRMTHHT